MNIFYLDPNPIKCAEQHVDKHVVKMILEYAQLLSTAHRILDGKERISTTASNRRVKVWSLGNEELDTKLYSATHANHPSAIWVRQSRRNYLWLVTLLTHLLEEYTYRYGKVHKVEATGLRDTLRDNFPKNMPFGDFTEPTPAMPDTYKVEGDSIASYRNYYRGGKVHLLSWKKREKPNWI